MHYKHTTSAQLILTAIAIALIGAGFIAPLGLDPDYALPTVLLVAIATALAGLVIGIHDDAGSVIIIGLILPMAMFPYSMLADSIIRHHAGYTFALVAAGAIPIGVLLANLRTRHVPHESRQTQSSHGSAHA